MTTEAKSSSTSATLTEMKGKSTLTPTEITSYAKALGKATAAGDPASNVITILKTLREGVVPTEELLRSTKIGVAVNRQKQAGDHGVARLAADIVQHWREEVAKQKKEAVAARKKDSDSSTAAVSAADSQVSQPLDKRTWKRDNVDSKRTESPIRNNCIGLLYDGLAFMSEDVPTLVLKRAMDIERAALQKYGSETSSDYKTKLRSLFHNLKSKLNPGLRKDVLDDVVTAERLINMTDDELKSPARREEDEKLQAINMKEAMVPKAERSISTAFRCGKCGQKKVSYSQAQTRSADEPMTTFCECQACGNRWKFS